MSLALALLAMATGYLTHIGYFGGPVFTPVPAAAPLRHRVAAVFLSGDFGFRAGLGPMVAGRLAADGMPVIGVNSLTFFRTPRTPPEVEALVADAIRRALLFGHADRVVLIGQSFGADMLHVGLARLPASLREKVALVALVVPGDMVEFRASPSEMFDFRPPDASAVPTASRLDWVPALCIHGAQEPHSLCPLLHQPNMRVMALPGGHQLDWDADRLHAALAAAIGEALDGAHAG